MNDEELESYYQQTGIKPKFNEYNVLNQQLFYSETGDTSAPVLLFIHGAPGRWYGYIEYLCDSSLISRYHLISVDRAGYGYSKPNKAVTSVKQQASLLLPLINKYAHHPIYIIGRSYGAPIAAMTAVLAGENVKGLILVSCAADPVLEKFWWFSPIVQSAIGKLIFRKPIDISSDEKYAHRAELNKMLGEWSCVKQPTLILQGGRDIIINPNNACFTDSVLINSPHYLIFLPENSHLITRERPDLIKFCIEKLGEMSRE